MNKQTDIILTVSEAALYARVSERTIRRAIRSGDLLAARHRGGRAWKIRKGDLDGWMTAETANNAHSEGNDRYTGYDASFVDDDFIPRR